ncbi:unnamed protein product [Arctogadus glacialis]
MKTMGPDQPCNRRRKTSERMRRPSADPDGSKRALLRRISLPGTFRRPSWGSPDVALHSPGAHGDSDTGPMATSPASARACAGPFFSSAWFQSKHIRHVPGGHCVPPSPATRASRPHSSGPHRPNALEP